MASKALQHKIAKLKAMAPYELDKARACAGVVIAVSQGPSAFNTALNVLKASQGNNWTVATAVQYLSGRRGEYAAQCAAPDEKDALQLAHLIAKQLCDDAETSGTGTLAGQDLEKWQRLVSAAAARVLASHA